MKLERLVGYLENKTILITGATSSVVKVSVEILRIQPTVKKMHLLLRDSDIKSATLRMHNEIIGNELFKIIKEKQGANFDSFISKKVVALPGDITSYNLGLKDFHRKEDLSNEIQIIFNSVANAETDERMSNDLKFIPLDYMGYQYLFWSYQVEQQLNEKGCMYTIQEPKNVHDTKDQSKDRAIAVDLMYQHLNPELQLDYGDITDPYTLWVTLQDRFVDMRDETISFWDNQWDKLRFDNCDDVHEYKSKLTHILQAMDAVGITIRDDKLIEKTLSTFPFQAKEIATALKQKCEDGQITSHDMLLSEIAIHEVLSYSFVPSDEESATGTRKRKRVPKKHGNPRGKESMKAQAL